MSEWPLMKNRLLVKVRTAEGVETSYNVDVPDDGTIPAPANGQLLGIALPENCSVTVIWVEAPPIQKETEG